MACHTPRIEAETQRRFDAARSAGEEFVVYDMPLLVDKGLHTGMDYTIVVEINVENLNGDFVANGDNLGRVVDVLPRQLGHVNQAVRACFTLCSRRASTSACPAGLPSRYSHTTRSVPGSVSIIARSALAASCE